MICLHVQCITRENRRVTPSRAKRRGMRCNNINLKKIDCLKFGIEKHISLISNFLFIVIR